MNFKVNVSISPYVLDVFSAVKACVILVLDIVSDQEFFMRRDTFIKSLAALAAAGALPSPALSYPLPSYPTLPPTC